MVLLINGNLSFESGFNFKETRESNIQEEVSNLNSEKAGTFGNSPTKILKYSFDICQGRRNGFQSGGAKEHWKVLSATMVGRQ